MYTNSFRVNIIYYMRYVYIYVMRVIATHYFTYFEMN